MSQQDDPVTLVHLMVNNIMRLRVAEVKTNGEPLMVIGGDNGQGKTSLLDSVAILLGDASNLPDMPVRTGADHGEIIGVLSNGLRIEKKITIDKEGKNKVALTVRAADGTKISSPRIILDSLLGELTFDPLAFMSMKPRDQAEALATLLHIDFKKLDSEYEEVYAQRRMLNRDLEASKGHIAKMPFYEDVPAQETSVLQMSNVLQEAMRKNAENDKKRRELKDAEDYVADMKKHIEEYRNTLAQMEANLAQCIPMAEQLKAEVASLTDEDTNFIRHEMSQVEEINVKVRQNQDREEAMAATNALQTRSDAMTQTLDGIQKEKVRLIQSVKMPVEGLAFDSAGVTYKGIPLAQCSAAEKLRISVAMAFSQNPGLRIALVRDGSLLDDKSMALIAEIAREHRGMLWVERVGKGQECSVIIEDGTIVEDRTK